MRRLSSLAISMAVILSSSSAQNLPYNPTRIFISPNDSNLVYIFSPSSTTFEAQLLSLNIASTLKASALNFNVLTANLPFVGRSTEGNPVAFQAAISASGNIGVYTGICSTNSSLWIYTPQNASSSTTPAIGIWQKAATHDLLLETGVSGANHLAASFYFSSLVNTTNSQRTLYSFGGMCSTSAVSNASTWQQEASYSNAVIKFVPQSGQTNSYQISAGSSTSNRPIPEAGFTMTGLTPIVSMSSSGVNTQSRNFVLLGGHTQTAFINMSQVAIFSLPQENWSFQITNPDTTQGSSELVIKSRRATTPRTPDSRSGHTAILTENGNAIVVFGGWVGDISQPAEPQLAILQLGSGFGGSGDWTWDIPSPSGTGLAAGTGLYGHGAVMLPGNVMMIYGGNPIKSQTTISRRSGITQAYFLNITSMVWSTEYSNPFYVATLATGGSGTGSSASSDAFGTAKRVGLGVGLGIGLAAVIGSIIVYICYSRRLETRRRRERDEKLAALSQEAMREQSGYWEGVSRYPAPMSTRRGGSGGQTSSLAYVPMMYGENNSYMNYEATAATSDALPGSVTIPRKPVNPRGSRAFHQQPSAGSGSGYSTHDFSIVRTNSLGTAGVIHPIYEDDEENENLGIEQTFTNGRGEHNMNNDDPFQDPPSTQSCLAVPVVYSPYSRDLSARDNITREREKEVSEWIADWAVADALLNNPSQSRAQSLKSHGGRLSPTKEFTSGRTESNLSERSMATVSAMGLSRQNSVNTRSNSLTTFFSGGAWNPFGGAATGLGSIDERANQHRNVNPGSVSPVSELSSGRGQNLHPPPSSSSNTSSSFITAHSSFGFPALKVEGETLLSHPEEIQPGSPSKNRRQKPFGWLGSLKRVLGGNEVWVYSDGSSESGRSSPYKSDHEHSPSFTGTPKYDTRTQFDRSEPRRTLSAGAAMWRRKQGRSDWQDSAEPGITERQSHTLASTRNPGEPLGTTLVDESGHPKDEEDDWDIEKAIERRVVQVMFTVPKEKLRVVNWDAHDEEKSDTGSILDIKNGADITEHNTGSFSEDLVQPSGGDAKEGEGKEKETLTDVTRSPEQVVRETIIERPRTVSPDKTRGKVAEMVQMMERRASPAL